MIWIANCLVALVAVLHLYFLTLEMFLWTKPLGLKTFRNTPEKAADSAVLAANQGLYNGFLAAGLIWGLVQGTPAFALPDQDVLSVLRDRRRRLWRRDRQPQDPVRSGRAGGDRIDPALAGVTSFTFSSRLILHCGIRSSSDPASDGGPSPAGQDHRQNHKHEELSDMRNGILHLVTGTARWRSRCRRRRPTRKRNTTPVRPTPRSRSARPVRSAARPPPMPPSPRPRPPISR